MVNYLEPETTVPQREETEIQTLWVFVPDDTAFPADDQNGVYLEFPAEAIDEYEGPVLVECDPSSGSLFPIGENVITCTAFNSKGEMAQDSFVLTIESTSGGIPNWIKQDAASWAYDEVDDQTFVSAIQHLIQEDILIPPTDGTVSEQSSEIPNWIKYNAAWWAYDEIDDQTFVDSLQWLISNGVIPVN